MHIELHLFVIVECLLVILLLAEHIVTRCKVLTVFVGVTTVIVLQTGSWPDTDVLVQELFCSKVVHEVLGCDESTLFIILLHDYSIQLSAGSLHHLLKLEGHCFVLVSANALIELLINFGNHTLDPVLNLIVHKLHFLIDLSRLVVLFLVLLNCNI